VKLDTFVTYLSRWSAAQDSRVDQACKLDMGDVTRGTVDAFKIPYRFSTEREEVSHMRFKEERKVKNSR
jgi:IS4 transposase